MKNRILLFITIILICIFPTYILAEEENPQVYTNLNISSIITTSADMSEISKIIIKCNVSKLSGNQVEETFTLVKSDQYSTSKYYDDMIDASFLYGYAVASDGTVDKYGFITIKPVKSLTPDTSTIQLDLQISFNDMGFDGKNYRKNTDLTDEEIEERKNGVAIKDSKITTSSIYTTIPTTTTLERKVINDDSNNAPYKSTNNDLIDSNKVLLYVGIIGGSLLIIIGIVVFFKYKASIKNV